ncbi:hypothetical protein O181_066994 [Austropuccinia psidii MF-1]|uniref:Uncharacterized protein n=1 Tax=Austropuccinia psidii MF-1 TaxID=1389203 RepID=A0A9Q3EU20_9BASI|nr:hypothetical protein [Austropuccinia psidii MF-1]
MLARIAVLIWAEKAGQALENPSACFALKDCTLNTKKMLNRLNCSLSISAIIARMLSKNLLLHAFTIAFSLSSVLCISQPLTDSTGDAVTCWTRYKLHQNGTAECYTGIHTFYCPSSDCDADQVFFEDCTSQNHKINFAKIVASYFEVESSSIAIFVGTDVSTKRKLSWKEATCPKTRNTKRPKCGNCVQVQN